MDDIPIPWTSIEYVHVANISEDVWGFIDSLPPERRINEIDENACLSDRNLFAELSLKNCLVITPTPVSTGHLAYIRDELGLNNIYAIAPSRHTGRICLDILNDSDLMSKLTELVRTRIITMTSYSASREFRELTDYLLRNAPGSLVTPEMPDKIHEWTTDFIGSKSGIRQITGSSSMSIRMSEGFIASSITEAACIGAYFHREYGGVVLKVPKGHSGAGVVILSPTDIYRTGEDPEAAILKRMKNEVVFENTPIIVERFVMIATEKSGGNPSLEFCVARDGEVRFLYSCTMRVTREGVFKGIEMGRDTILPETEAVLRESGRELGRKFSSLGYRGYFDVDCIISTDGKLYLSECNLRRTGGTHAYKLARHLLGDDFARQYYVLAHNLYDLPERKSGWDYSLLGLRLRSIFYDSVKQEGLIITSASLLDRKQFGYVIIAVSRDQALMIEKRMEVSLQE